MRLLFHRVVSRIEPACFLIPILALLGGLGVWFIGNSLVFAVALTASWALVSVAGLLAISFQPGPRLLRHLSAAVVLVVTGGIAGLASLVPLVAEPKVVADKPALRLTRSRLRVVAQDLDRIPPFATVPKPVRISGCGVDSGSPLQPAVEREWNTDMKDATPIAEALIALGWVGSAVADANGSFHLSKEFTGWSASAFVGNAFDVFPASVYVRIDGMEPCSLAD